MDASVVVLIDTFFCETPAPTHFELIRLMQAGVKLIGAASAGALRAVELASLGMIGVGHVYHAYLQSRIVDDSEVALLMCPRTFRALTVPLVNVRRLLADAIELGVGPQEAAEALEIASAMHFADRDEAALKEAWRRGSLGSAELLISLMGRPECDVKRADSESAVRFALKLAREGTLPAPLHCVPGGALYPNHRPPKRPDQDTV